MLNPFLLGRTCACPDHGIDSMRHKRRQTFPILRQILYYEAVFMRNLYPIPPMDEYINAFGKVIVFSTLDASNVYRQIEIDEADKDKTAFRAHSRL